jgi:hypothetical protein
MLENISLFIFLTLIVLAVVVSLFGNKQLPTLFLFIFSFLYLVYSSGRIGGVDTPFYRAVFGDNERCRIFEYGFQLLCSFDYSSGFSFTFLLSSILLLLFIYRSSDNYQVRSLTFLILFPLYFITVDLGYLRQSISTSILLIFCFNQPNRKIRTIGYLSAPFFHISSIFLIFFFELIYSKGKINRFVLMGGIFLISIAIFFMNKFINADIAGLLSKEFSFLSSLNLLFLFLLTSIACIQFRWKFRVIIFVMLTCIAGYFGHIYRVYLFLVPIIAVGVANYLVRINITHRIISILLLITFGYSKLNAAVYEFDGAFDIPYSDNSLFWFLGVYSF